MSADPADSLVGQTLDGRYHVEEQIGRGGMGEVYRGRHVMMDHAVALKVLRADLVDDPTAARRFAREARSTFRLDHPNCVRVTDFGAAPGGILFLVMELLDGRTVGDELEHDGAFACARVIHIGRQVCEALACAHEAGLIHRDLKPDNLMLIRRGDDPDFVKVLDFGLAKLFDDGPDPLRTALSMSPLTQQGMVFGTPEYMSPEQATGQSLGPATDLYSLGVVLYEMITGKLPFEGPGVMAMLKAHVTQAPAPPSHRRPDLGIPRALDAAILRCLAKQPRDRPASARELAATLAAVAGAGEVRSRVPAEVASSSTVELSSSHVRAASAEPAAGLAGRGPWAARPGGPRVGSEEPPTAPARQVRAGGAQGAETMLLGSAPTIAAPSVPLPHASLAGETLDMEPPAARGGAPGTIGAPRAPEAAAAPGAGQQPGLAAAGLPDGSRGQAFEPAAGSLAHPPAGAGIPRSRAAPDAGHPQATRADGGAEPALLSSLDARAGVPPQPTAPVAIRARRSGGRRTVLALVGAAVVAGAAVALVLRARGGDPGGPAEPAAVAPPTAGSISPAAGPSGNVLAPAAAPEPEVGAAPSAPPDAGAPTPADSRDARAPGPAATPDAAAPAVAPSPSTAGSRPARRPRLGPEQEQKLKEFIRMAESFRRDRNWLRQTWAADEALRIDRRNRRAALLLGEALIEQGDTLRGCKYLKQARRLREAREISKRAGCGRAD